YLYRTHLPGAYMQAWIKIALGLLLVLGLMVVFLPALLHTSWGKKQLVAYANSQIPGHLAANSMKLSWLNGQQIEGVTLHDPMGQEVASVGHLKLESPLLKLMWSGLTEMRVSIQGLKATIARDEKGITNLQRALQRLPPPASEMKVIP